MDIKSHYRNALADETSFTLIDSQRVKGDISLVIVAELFVKLPHRRRVNKIVGPNPGLGCAPFSHLAVPGFDCLHGILEGLL